MRSSTWPLPGRKQGMKIETRGAAPTTWRTPPGVPCRHSWRHGFWPQSREEIGNIQARAVCFAVMFILGISQASGEFRYYVERDKFRGRESGVLVIGEDGIQYRSENGKTAFDFAFENIREADLSDPKKIQLYTYDRAKKRLTAARRFEFNLRDGTTSPELIRFLAARLERPLVGVYVEGIAGLEIPAYHRHVLKGCHGVLRFGRAGVAFESRESKHSRTWTYKDIQTIGTMNAFHFRLTSYAETFNFDLKKRLSPEDYRTLWRRVYMSDFQVSEVRDSISGGR